MNKLISKLFLFTTLIFSLAATIAAQASVFTYQGRLTDGAMPASGVYDLRFALFDEAGTQIGATEQRDDVSVAGGVFTVQLDFTQAAFDGGARVLEISVRRGAETGAFTALTPRQPITSTPYAIRSSQAATATNALNIGGTPAAQIITESDARLTNTRDPNAGSVNYVQNSTTQQSGTTNFNISGDGAASTFNAATGYSIGGNRVLSVAGSLNVFAGVSAGAANTGSSNSFFGREAGEANTTGGNNSFFGMRAGEKNTIGSQNSFLGGFAGFSNETGSNNSFFGRDAGGFNTTGGNNSFFGRSAGLNNTTGSSNTIVGNKSNVAAGDLMFAAAFGANAIVSQNDTIVLGKVAGNYNDAARPADAVVIPGSLTVAGTINGTVTNATNAAQLGGTAANQFVHTNDARLSDARTPIAGSANYIQNGTTQQTSAGFNVSGDGTIGGTLSGNVVNAATAFNIGGFRVFNATSISGTLNTLVGASAGQTSSNTGTENVFVGTQAGNQNSSGSLNSFVGRAAGILNSAGGYNSFFGNSAGLFNTSGSNNSFFGINAGQTNSAGGNNTALGGFANFGANNLNFATAIGSNAVVNASDTIVIGKVAGTYNSSSRPADAVQIPGTMTVAGSFSAASISTAGSFFANVINAGTQYNIGGIRAFIVSGDNTIAGPQAGESGSGSGNSFYGKLSGRVTSGNNNSIFGNSAGSSNSTGGFNSFFGQLAGERNTTGGQNSFFGRAAGGQNISGSNNSALGTGADMASGDLTFATAIGSGANVSSSNTVVLGRSADAVQIPGTLTVAGSVSANRVNSATEFTISGNRKLRIDSLNNILVGTLVSGSGGSEPIAEGSSNSFFGINTGVVANNGTGFPTSGSNNTLLGAQTNLIFPNLNYATAIGSGARVSTSNTIVLGRSDGSDSISASGRINASGGIDAGGGIALQSSSLRLLAADDNNNRIYYNTGINGIVFSAGDGFSWFNVRNNRINMFLDTTGNLGIVGSYGQVSDARFKTNIQTFAGALDSVRRLRGVTFNWKPELNKSSDTQIGFIAQEVEAVLPQLVLTDKEGYKTVSYSNAVPVLVEAIKEQQLQIERQQKQIGELKQIVCAIKPDAAVCQTEDK